MFRLSVFVFVIVCFSIGKDFDAGRDWRQEEKGMTEDEMAGWHHWLDGCESEWTPGDGDGQGGLACCNSWGCKESDTTERLNWTELRWKVPCWHSVSLFSKLLNVYHSSIYSIINTEKLLCARYCSRFWKYKPWIKETRAPTPEDCNVVSGSVLNTQTPDGKSVGFWKGISLWFQQTSWLLNLLKNVGRAQILAS